MLSRTHKRLQLRLQPIASSSRSQMSLTLAGPQFPAVRKQYQGFMIVVPAALPDEVPPWERPILAAARALPQDGA